MMDAALKSTYCHEMGTPIGQLLLVGSEARLEAIHFQSGPQPTAVRPEWIPGEGPFRSVILQLRPN